MLGAGHTGPLSSVSPSGSPPPVAGRLWQTLWLEHRVPGEDQAPEKEAEGALFPAAPVLMRVRAGGAGACGEGGEQCAAMAEQQPILTLWLRYTHRMAELLLLFRLYCDRTAFSLQCQALALLTF